MSGVRFYNLASGQDAPQRLEGDLCIIGAGAAGIYLATRLGQEGFNVILLEAGPQHGSNTDQIDFNPEFEHLQYHGATVGRCFGVGGSTFRWGGLLVPHLQQDVRSEPTGVWQSIIDTVQSHKRRVLKHLGYHGREFNSSDEGPFTTSRYKALAEFGIDTVSSLFLPFYKKNLKYLLKQIHLKCTTLHVVYHAVVNDWQVTHLANGAHLQQVYATSVNGNLLSVKAKKFIITAGALESARLLLELNQLFSQPLIRPQSAIGCYLSDHLSIPIAQIRSEDQKLAIKRFAPYFIHGWLRGVRFLESNPPLDAPRAFFHFVFDNQNDGFILAKKILSSLQHRRFPSISYAQVCRGSTGFARLAFDRVFRSSLYIPSTTKIALQMDMEQIPVRTNAVKLHAQRDQYGRRKLTIAWKIGEKNLEQINLASSRFLKQWPMHQALWPTLVPRIDHDIQAKDAYHPTGTCRMGDDLEAVVDCHLLVYGIKNLWVVSTGVLPSAGTANPTFTMLCLAERLIEQLKTDEYHAQK